MEIKLLSFSVFLILGGGNKKIENSITIFLG